MIEIPPSAGDTGKGKVQPLGGRSPGRGHGNRLGIAGKKSMDRGALVGEIQSRGPEFEHN